MSRPLQAADTDELKAYIGTYTNGQSEGIYLLQLSIAGDEIKSSKLTLAGKAANPSFLALHPGGKLLYAVNEFTPARDGETPRTVRARYRTIGDANLTAAVESDADSVEKIVAEIAAVRITERGATRGDDKVSDTSMEDRKKEGYF